MHKFTIAGAPLQASVFICRHKGMLHHCNSAAASYLFQVSHAFLFLYASVYVK